MTIPTVNASLSAFGPAYLLLCIISPVHCLA